jgi:hypothetical protein
LVNPETLLLRRGRYPLLMRRSLRKDAWQFDRGYHINDHILREVLDSIGQHVTDTGNPPANMFLDKADYAPDEPPGVINPSNFHMGETYCGKVINLPL